MPYMYDEFEGRCIEVSKIEPHEMDLIHKGDLIHLLESEEVRTAMNGCKKKYTKGFRYAVTLVKRAQTVDTNCGYWKDDGSCSRCGNYDTTDYNTGFTKSARYNEPPYCMWCGAHMDEK